MFSQLFAILVLSVVATGCGVQAHTYVMKKERADIENLSEGNAGYIRGTPQYQEPDRKTRKIYVLEVTKALKEGEVKKIEETTTVSEHIESDAPAMLAYQEPTPTPKNRAIVIPPIEDEPAAPSSFSSSASDIEYTVQKDDTLQKIAKKFYDSYGKWTKIYEANKSKIKNPNFVKPGTVLTIPAADKKQ
jgi:nucleoid-associated protein YgaU